MVVSRLLWVPGTELRSSVRAGSILNRLACTAAPESLRRNRTAFYRVSHPDLCPLFPIKKSLLTLLQNSGIEMDLPSSDLGADEDPRNKVWLSQGRTSELCQSPGIVSHHTYMR